MTSEIYIVDKKGVSELFIDVSPVLVRGIHKTEKNEVLVGVLYNVSLEKRYELTDEGRRQVIVFDMKKNNNKMICSNMTKTD